MLNRPLDILTQFPVRRTNAQKQAFRDAVQAYFERMDYSVSVEHGRFVSQNLVIGDPEKAKYLVTAHYDTCTWLSDDTSGVVTLLEIARTLPENQRHKVCFVLFDLGSNACRRGAHKEAAERQILLELDCVGDGDHIRLIPTKKLKKDRKRLTSLYKACGYVGKKTILVHEKGLGLFPLPPKNFPYGIVICALRKNKFCYYRNRIHTKKETVLDETNVNILRAALTSFICCDAVN